MPIEQSSFLEKANIPKWMTKRKTQKYSQKETVPSKYRPITYLSMMWKILTALIREEIYYSQVSPELSRKNRKRCYKVT